MVDYSSYLYVYCEVRGENIIAHDIQENKKYQHTPEREKGESTTLKRVVRMRTGLKIMDIKKDINANMWIPIHDIHSGVNDCYMRIQEVAKILCIDKGEIEKCYKQHLLAEQYTMITPDGKWSESVFGAEVGFNYSAVEILMEFFNINNDLMKEALEQSYNLKRYNCYMN